MRVGDSNHYACNAQATADEKAAAIVACEATRQKIDASQRHPLAGRRGKTLAWPRPTR